MRTLAVALIALLVCSTFVLAQTGTPNPRLQPENPAPGAIGQTVFVLVNGISIAVPDPACQRATYQALNTGAPVPVSDPKCTEAMNKALTIQSQSPEPTDSPTPDAADAPPAFVLAQTGTPNPGLQPENPAPGALPESAGVGVAPGVMALTDRPCQLAIARALAAQAPVPVPADTNDPKCAELMEKALTFQSEYLPPAGSPTPDAADAPPAE